MRNMRRRALSLAAALLFASAGAAFGAVSGEDTINGKALDDVHDIVKEMSGGEAVIPKTQLMTLTVPSKSGIAVDADLWTAPLGADRSASENDRKVDQLSRYSYFYDHDHFMGVQSAASTRVVPGSGAKRRVVIGDIEYSTGKGGFKTFLTEPASGPSTKISGSVRALPLKISGWEQYLVLTDLRGGLFIDGEADESFVAGILDDDHTYTFDDGKKFRTFDHFDFGGRNVGGRIDQLGVLILDGHKLNDESFTGDPTGGKMIDTFESTASIPVVRVVAGDFDGDGIPSEIAYISTPTSSDADTYSVHVRKVSRDASGAIKTDEIDSFDVGTLYMQNQPHSDLYRTDLVACDIVAGDFDGDFRTEFAVVVWNDGGDADVKPLVQTFKYIGGGFKTKGETFTEFVDLKGSLNDPSHIPGVLAAAGDFDGDGHDEMALITANYFFSNFVWWKSTWGQPYMASFAFTPEKGEAPRPVLKGPRDSKGKVPELPFKLKFDSENDNYAYVEPLAHIVSLAAGPSYGAAGDGGFFEELYMSAFIDDTTEMRLFRFPSPLANNSSVHLGTVQNVRTGLIAADFAGESLLLGDPTHIITEETRSYTHIVPAVPYHIDYIRDDWRRDQEDAGPDRKLQLVTPPTSLVTYTKSETESDQADTSFEMRSHFEWNVGGSANLKFPIKEVGFNAGAEGGYKHSSEKITKSLASDTVSRSTKIDAKVQFEDLTNYYAGTLHVWRYPIVGTYADDPKLIDAVFADENGGGDVLPNDPLKNAPMDTDAQKYYTIVRLAELKDGYLASERYQPDHDERNLFSYPNKLQHDKSYTTYQEMLASPAEIPTDKSITYEVTFDSVKSHTNSEVLTESSGGSLSLTGGIAIPAGKKSVFTLQPKGGFSTNKTVSNGSTFTSTAKSSTKYSVAMVADAKNWDTAFSVTHAAYVDAGGVTTLAFAVDLRPGFNYLVRAWDKDGPYGSAPDPSLLLPHRVAATTDPVPVAVMENIPKEATRLRGVRIYDLAAGEDPEVGTSYTTSTLIKGRTYAIVVPVYNASFVDTGDFQVKLGYTTRDHLESVMKQGSKRVLAEDDAEITAIGERTVSLKGWDHNSDAHRGKVRFDWTVPADDNKVPAGYYDFCVRIVGKNGDIHREWNFDETSSEYDPCGNDWGHFAFSVVEEKDFESDVINYVSREDGKVSIAAETSEPKIDLTFHVDGEAPMTLDAFRRWLEGRSAPVKAEVEVAYTGDRVVVGANAVIYELLEDGRTRGLLDRDLTSIFPGTSVKRVITIDPQKFLPRNLRVKITGSNITQVHGDEPTEGTGGGSGGCAAGAASLVAIAALGALGTKTLRRRGK